MRSLYLFISIVIVLGAAGIAAKTTNKKPKKLPVPKTKGAHAVGAPDYGILFGAQELDRDGESIAILPDHWKRKRQYTTPAMADLLTHAASDIYKSFGRRVMLGDLSAKQGGWVWDHISHQNGLDADVILFYKDSSGSPFEPTTLVALDEKGKSKDGKYQLDAALCWRFIELILNDSSAQVQFIFLADPLVDLVLAAGKKASAKEEILQRARTIMAPPPQFAEPHKDHMHVRIYCPSDAENLCEDTGPVWDWITLTTSLK